MLVGDEVRQRWASESIYQLLRTQKLWNLTPTPLLAGPGLIEDGEVGE